MHLAWDYLHMVADNGNVALLELRERIYNTGSAEIPQDAAPPVLPYQQESVIPQAPPAGGARFLHTPCSSAPVQPHPASPHPTSCLVKKFDVAFQKVHLPKSCHDIILPVKGQLLYPNLVCSNLCQQNADTRAALELYDTAQPASCAFLNSAATFIHLHTDRPKGLSLLASCK